MRGATGAAGDAGRRGASRHPGHRRGARRLRRRALARLHGFARASTRFLAGYRRPAPYRARLGASRRVRPRTASAPRRSTTYLLELLSTQPDALFWSRDNPASVAVEWACSLLRHGPPTPAERVWYFASVAILRAIWVVRIARPPQACGEPVPRRSAMDARRSHCPRRSHLAGAQVRRRTCTCPVKRIRPSSTRSPARRRCPSVHLEAEVRWGDYERRRGHVDDALAHFAKAGQTSDRNLQVLARPAAWPGTRRGRPNDRRARRVPVGVLAMRRTPRRRRSPSAPSSSRRTGNRKPARLPDARCSFDRNPPIPGTCTPAPTGDSGRRSSPLFARPSRHDRHSRPGSDVCSPYCPPRERVARRRQRSGPPRRP